MPKRDKIFVSYSHKDKRLFQEFKTMMAPAIQQELVDLWDDQRIPFGAQWKREIQTALASAKIAVLLVSKNFLASHFIVENELAPLLKAARDEGVIVFWIYLSSCLFERTEIASFQAAHDISQPLDRLSKPKRQAVLSETCAKLIQAAAHEPLSPIQARPHEIDEQRPSHTLPHLSHGTWTLRNAIDDSGKDWSNSALKFTSESETPDGLRFRGIFTWRLDNVLVGTEEFTGHYRAATRQLFFEGTFVTDIPHPGDMIVTLSSYSAVVSPDERTISDGRWGATRLKAQAGVSGRWEAFR